MAVSGTVHLLPGRIRLAVPGLLGNRPLAVWLEAQLARIPGIRSVQANPLTGRALVLYEPGRATGAALAHRVIHLIRSCHEAAATVELASQRPVPPNPPGAPADPGLPAAEARRRLRRFGPNVLNQAPGPTFGQRLLEQFRDPMVLTLLSGAGISLLAGRGRDALTITSVLMLNAVVGASQAGKAEGALDALRRMSAPRARVIRNGSPTTIPAAEVVPGDLLLLEAGDKIPADALVLTTAAAEADESLLTGESHPVMKVASAPDADPGGGIGRPDMLFAGATLTRGRCTARVVATGMRTEMGRIAALLREARPGPTPLQRRMEELGRTLVRGSLLVCGGVALIGLLRGKPVGEMILTGVSLAVAAIPEGLPTFVTLGLAAGVRQMARRRALVRQLQAVETLGSATVICTDKTGTLTRNQMTVRQVWAGGRWYEFRGTGRRMRSEIRRDGRLVTPGQEADLMRLLTVGAVCNNAAARRDPSGWRVLGDATEGALLLAAAHAGLNPARHRRTHRRTAELPFDPARRCMSVLCAGPEGPCVYTKGAPEAVLAVCTHMSRDGRQVRLTAKLRREILTAARTMAGRAYRVLATAYRPLPNESAGLAEEQLIFLGLAGLMDPPRPEVPAALARCRRAGIRVIMLTGDHPETARAVASEIGLLEPGDLVLTGAEIAQLTDRELQSCAGRLRVCARASPEQKLRVVRALRARGHVVAMTGDGVNDAPAVKEADVGIAMGQAGTEVTKEAAGLVLADDNFSTIVAAVEQGRVTYNNIRRSIRYLLASNIGELVLMAAAIALGFPLPLIPLQILWLNLVGDGLPALALGSEPAEGNEMAGPPRARGESVFAGGLGGQLIRNGVRMGAAGLALFLWALRAGKPLPVVRTVTLCGLVLGQLIYLLRCGSRRLRNRSRTLTWAALASAVVLAGSVYLPPLQRLLHLAPLRPAEWAAAGLAAAAGSL